MSSSDSNAQKPNPGVVGPNFKLVFSAVTGCSVLFVILAVCLGLYNASKPDDGLKTLIDKLFVLANIGFGAMVGLLGGKSTQ